jgi:hypothetical protein
MVASVRRLGDCLLNRLDGWVVYRGPNTVVDEVVTSVAYWRRWWPLCLVGNRLTTIFYSQFAKYCRVHILQRIRVYVVLTTWFLCCGRVPSQVLLDHLPINIVVARLFLVKYLRGGATSWTRSGKPFLCWWGVIGRCVYGWTFDYFGGKDGGIGLLSRSPES